MKETDTWALSYGVKECVFSREMRNGVSWRPAQFKVGFSSLGLVALGVLWLFMGMFGKEAFSFLA